MPSSQALSLSPGQLRVNGDRLFVACGAGTALDLLQLQPEGKKSITAREFLSGYHPAEGEKIG